MAREPKKLLKQFLRQLRNWPFQIWITPLKLGYCVWTKNVGFYFIFKPKALSLWSRWTPRLPCSTLPGQQREEAVEPHLSQAPLAGGVWTGTAWGGGEADSRADPERLACVLRAPGLGTWPCTLPLLHLPGAAPELQSLGQGNTLCVSTIFSHWCKLPWSYHCLSSGS